MASYTARKNKAGDIISYQIKVTRGRDKITGKQLTPFTMTYTPPEGWSKRAIERDLQKVMGEFEAACKRGEVLTKEEAKAKAIADREEAKRKAEEERRKPTFSAYIETYLKEREPTLALNTIQRYKQSLGRANAFLGDYKMIDIDIVLIKSYMSHLQTDGLNEKNGEKLSFNTILCDYQALNTLFENAVENGVIEDNPMRKMKAPKRPKDEAKKEPMSYDEETTAYIIECLNKEPLMWKALILFLIDSGCRRGEAVGLKWSDINFQTGEVIISRNAQCCAGHGTFITTPKSHKSRSVFLNPVPLAVLKTWKREQAMLFFKLGISNQGFCFTKYNGEMMNPSQPTTYLRNTFAKKYNLPGIHPHALRHTMATLSIANGADVVSVSKKLGHSTPAITLNVYSHANEEAQRRANEKLADAIYNTKQA